MLFKTPRIQYTEKLNNTLILKESYTYDTKGQVSRINYFGNVTRSETYTYKGNAVDYVTKIVTGSYTVQPKQDIDERYTGKSVAINGIAADTERVIYVKEGSNATNMPKQITYPNTYIAYTYDGNGNITQIMQGGVLQAKYTYDTLGRLIREDNKYMNKSYFYTYDNNGNILAKESCAFTTGNHTVGTGTVTSYSYTNDKMTQFGSESCVYDAVGNPTTYRGKAATWARGRKLTSYNGTTFSYSAQGVRLKKGAISYYHDSKVFLRNLITKQLLKGCIFRKEILW